MRLLAVRMVPGAPQGALRIIRIITAALLMILILVTIAEAAAEERLTVSVLLWVLASLSGLCPSVCLSGAVAAAATTPAVPRIVGPLAVVPVYVRMVQ